MLSTIEEVFARHPQESFTGLLALLIIAVLAAYHTFSAPLRTSSSTRVMGAATSTADVDDVTPAAGPAAGAFVPSATKMALVVRADLGMGNGKVAAQCAHASVAAVEKCMDASPASYPQWGSWLHQWIEKDSSDTVTFKVASEASLQRVAAEAKAAGIPFYLVRDAGRTQIAAGSRTVVSVGPAPVETVDKLTASLEPL